MCHKHIVNRRRIDKAARSTSQIRYLLHAAVRPLYAYLQIPDNDSFPSPHALHLKFEVFICIPPDLYDDTFIILLSCILYNFFLRDCAGDFVYSIRTISFFLSVPLFFFPAAKYRTVKFQAYPPLLFVSFPSPAIEFSLNRSSRSINCSLPKKLGDCRI